MGFEVFERPPGGRKADSVMRVRVSADGRMLHLNSKAYRQLGEPARLLLLRDGDNIGLSPASPDDERAFSSMQGNVSCTEFIRWVGLTPGARLPLRVDGGLLRSDGRGD